MWSAMIADMTNATTARFANTYCSQCGMDLGPGDSGKSHCADHTTTAPQSYYPEEIDTLRAMIADERERMDMLNDKPLTASRAYSMGVSQRRIDALETAIEALGGAL
jgi:hypothetical protein